MKTASTDLRRRSLLGFLPLMLIVGGAALGIWIGEVTGNSTIGVVLGAVLIIAGGWVSRSVLRRAFATFYRR